MPIFHFLKYNSLILMYDSLRLLMRYLRWLRYVLPHMHEQPPSIARQMCQHLSIGVARNCWRMHHMSPRLRLLQRYRLQPMFHLPTFATCTHGWSMSPDMQQIPVHRPNDLDVPELRRELLELLQFGTFIVPCVFESDFSSAWRSMCYRDLH